MLEESNPQIKKAVAVLKELSQDERTRLLYEEREKVRRDMMSRLDGAIQEIARNLLLLAVPIETIAKATGLSEDDIKKLQ